MEMSQTTVNDERQAAAVTVTVNNKPVVLTKHRLTGLEITQAAISQGVAIEPDFILTLEGKSPKAIDDDELVSVNKHSEFLANDSDDGIIVELAEQIG
jgi:hypothetical protein